MNGALICLDIYKYIYIDHQYVQIEAGPDKRDKNKEQGVGDRGTRGRLDSIT